MTAKSELERLREDLARREAELAEARARIAALVADIDETNRGVIALHAELEQARQAEARLAGIVQSSDDAMYSLTSDHRVQTWNAGAERLLGYTAEEIIGHPIEVMIPEEVSEDFHSAILGVKAGETGRTFETRRQRKDGTLVDVSVTLSPIRDDSGVVTGVSAVLRDITARLRTEQELAIERAERDVLAERERIARDLHDHVIQRIFAAGMALQGAAVVFGDADLSERLSRVCDDLDTTIADIRTTIFAITGHGRREGGSVRAQILRIVTDARGSLGFAPAARFHGPVDSEVSEQVADHVLAVVREALSNIARHADASSVEVTVTAADDLVVEIHDDGVGIGETSRRSGLGNLRERAEMLGGSFDVTGVPGDGTTLRWRAPLR